MSPIKLQGTNSVAAPGLTNDGGDGVVVGTDSVDISIGGASKVKVDSSGRVLVGATTEGHVSADDLTVETAGHTGITVRSGTSNQGSIYFSDATSGAAEYAGWIRYDHSGNNLTIGTDENERLRIDDVGRTLIGHTASLSEGCLLQVARTNDNTVELFGYSANTNGARITFTKSRNGTVGTNETERIRIQSDGVTSIPGGIELGSGLDGTAANTMDDYEEGDWDPLDSNGGTVLSHTHGRYTKVGNLVHIDFDITNDSGGNVTSIWGLPFQPINYATFRLGWISGAGGGAQSSETTLRGGYVSTSGNLDIRIPGGNASVNWADTVRIIGSADYRTS